MIDPREKQQLTDVTAADQTLGDETGIERTI